MVRATVGADTALAQIARLVTEAQSGKAPVQRLADRVSGVFVPVVIALAVATLGFWLGGKRERDVRVHRRGGRAHHRVPVRARPGDADGADGGTGRGAQLGLLIRGPEVLESTRRRVDTVLLDKTGTVTTGQMSLVDVAVADGADRQQALRLAGALENASEHPIAAIAQAATGPAARVERFANREGLGVEGVVDGHAVVVGAPGAARRARHAPARRTRGGRRRGRGARADRGRHAAGTAGRARSCSSATRSRRKLGRGRRGVAGARARPVLVTGDESTARAVGAEVGIDEVVAEVLPSRRPTSSSACRPTAASWR